MQGIILVCMAVLGLILAIMGVIAAFMFIFGIGKVRVGGRNKLQIKITGIEIGIETGHVYFAVVLGLLLTITPFPISRYFGDVEKANAEDIATPITPKVEEAEYTISKEEIRIDLRKRKEIGLSDYLAGDLSDVEWLIRGVIKDAESGVEEVNFHHATSGHSIVLIDIPQNAKWRRIEEESEEVVYHPFVDLLIKKEFFRDLLARKGRMRTYYMTVPITVGKGQEQEIVYKLRYHNAFQGRDFEWAGKVLGADTDILTLRIIFPEDKPFISIETYKKEAPKAQKITINDPDIETAPGNQALTWRIQDAKKGEVYYIKWEW